MKKVIKPLDEGSIYETIYGEVFKVVWYIGRDKILIEFLDETAHLHWTSKCQILRGDFRNPYRKTVYDRGFLGFGKYKTKDGRKDSLEYKTWAGIFRRCYEQDDDGNNLEPTYQGCEVDERWYNFQNFASWFCSRKQYGLGWHLDKDITVSGNKVYGPDTCTMLPAQLNTLIVGERLKSRELPVGVYKDPYGYRAGTGKVYAGFYRTVEEAHRAYKVRKGEYIREVAEGFKEFLDVEAFDKLMNFEVK